MLKDITVGQYYPTGSIIHKTDPRVKIIVNFIYIIFLFIINFFIDPLHLFSEYFYYLFNLSQCVRNPIFIFYIASFLAGVC